MRGQSMVANVCRGWRLSDAGPADPLRTGRPAIFGGIRILRGAIAGAILGATISISHAAGDAAQGSVLFNRCSICHSNAKNGPNKLGPNLFGVVGRKAGTYSGFSYSAAMKRAGFVWTPAKLMDYLASPQKVVPGNAMPFAGIGDAKQRADILAYLGTLR